MASPSAACVLTRRLTCNPRRRWKGQSLGPPPKVENGSNPRVCCWSSPIIDRVTALDYSLDGKTLASGGGDPSRSGEVLLGT